MRVVMPAFSLTWFQGLVTVNGVMMAQLSISPGMGATNVKKLAGMSLSCRLKKSNKLEFFKRKSLCSK